MNIIETALPGVLILEPRRFGDERGWFMESWNRETLSGYGIEIDFVQDNHSYSGARGTVRGLHYQAPPHAQAKLVRVAQGMVRDVAVDVRRGSTTYGHHVVVDLSAENGRQLLVPEGFLHGFATLTPKVELLYKCSAVYAPECDGAVAWDDPDLGIDWGIDPATATLSEKDRAAQRFADWTSPFSA